MSRICSRSLKSLLNLLTLTSFVGFSGAQAVARDFRVTSWNMDWLSRRPAGAPDLPLDRPIRSDADYERFARVFSLLNADILALQEVDGPEALNGLLPAHAYKVVFSPSPIAQRVLVAVRANLEVTVNPAVTALDLSGLGHHRLREGVDVTVSDGEISLRILAVHLKTGCWENGLTERGHSCPLLYRQFAIISSWVAARRKAHTPFLVMGDFNRRLTPSDPAFSVIRGDGALSLATAGYASPCDGGTYFIDNILKGGPDITFKDGSLRVMTSATQGSGGILSDHCPISVTVTVGTPS